MKPTPDYYRYLMRTAYPIYPVKFHCIFELFFKNNVNAGVLKLQSFFDFCNYM